MTAQATPNPFDPSENLDFRRGEVLLREDGSYIVCHNPHWHHLQFVPASTEIIANRRLNDMLASLAGPHFTYMDERARDEPARFPLQHRLWKAVDARSAQAQPEAIPA